MSRLARKVLGRLRSPGDKPPHLVGWRVAIPAEQGLLIRYNRGPIEAAFKEMREKVLFAVEDLTLVWDVKPTFNPVFSFHHGTQVEPSYCTLHVSIVPGVYDRPSFEKGLDKAFTRFMAAEPRH